MEAGVVEVGLNGEFSFGINWSADAHAGALRGNTSAVRVLNQALAPLRIRHPIGLVEKVKGGFPLVSSTV